MGRKKCYDLSRRNNYCQSCGLSANSANNWSKLSSNTHTDYRTVTSGIHGATAIPRLAVKSPK